MGMSRTALARRAGVHRVSLERITSPTEPSDPRLGSVSRLAHALGYSLAAVPRREVILDRALGAAVAEVVAEDPEQMMSAARERLEQFGKGQYQQHYTQLWLAIIDAGVDKVIEVHLDSSADVLRSTSPFVPILSSEVRQAVRAAVRVIAK
jgi:hypothetical protein